MKKLIFALTLFFIFSNTVSALEVKSENYILYNLDNNTIVLEKDKDEQVAIASLAKIMTVLVAIENIDNIKEEVVITNNMLKGLVEQDLAVVGLTIGQRVTYEDLLYASLLASGADAIKALVLKTVGSEEKFVTLMNDKAKDMKLKNTNFVNTVGLDAKGQYSTVNEVATILKNALKNDTFNKIFNTKTYTFHDGSIKVNSTLVNSANRLGLNLDYIKGAKTGFTDEAGRCLASVAYDSENNINYMLVTVKAPTPSSKSYHVVDSDNIYDYVFTNYKNYNLTTKGKKVYKIKAKYSEKEEVSLVASKDILYYTNEFDKSKVKMEYEGKESVSYKDKKNSVIGTVTVSYDGKKIDTVEAILDEKIDFSLAVFLIDNIWCLIVEVILVIVLVLFLKKKRRRRKRRKK